MVRYGKAEVKPQLEHLSFYFHSRNKAAPACALSAGKQQERLQDRHQHWLRLAWVQNCVVWGLKEKSTMVPMSYCGQCTVETVPCLPVHVKTKDKGVEQWAGAVL